jgi:hypothetical protein
MIDQHPITPLPELATHWLELWNNMPVPRANCIEWIATRAAQWGADQELEACVEHLKNNSWAPNSGIKLLRAARRPKPPSLKEQALESVKRFELGQDELSDLAVIRRALEALPDG